MLQAARWQAAVAPVAAPGAGGHTLAMATTVVYLVRHAKAAARDDWSGADRDRPLVERGRVQADRLARALRPERPALVAASPWLRCQETAEPLAAAVGVQVELDDRLGYDGPDLAAWIRAVAQAHPGGAAVGVSHGDLIPLYLLRARLVSGVPDFRTGSLFRLEVSQGRVSAATLVDRRELKRRAEEA
jgi:broad specificity phosphatase PhoE